MSNLTVDPDSEFNQDNWRILIVADDEDVHKNIHLVLDNCVYNGKSVALFSAYSVDQAKSLLRQQPNFALLFLDMVIGAHDAGLQLVRCVRQTLKDNLARIILCIDQPDYALAEEVIFKYEINSYVNKPELNHHKLLTLTIASLRAYADLILRESYRQSLEAKVVKLTQELQETNLIFYHAIPGKLKWGLDRVGAIAILIRYYGIERKNELSKLTEQNIIDFASMIEASFAQTRKLMKNLLEIYLIENYQRELLLRQLELRDIVQKVIDLDDIKFRAKSKDITIHLQAQETVYLALVDERDIHRVLNNIISKAIESSPVGKSVLIRLSQDKHRSKIEIQDEGPGLSKIEQQDIFKKFWCVFSPSSIMDEQDQFGLDFFIVKKLVENMNGEVWCDSQEGKGTSFIVTFPKPAE